MAEYIISSEYFKCGDPDNEHGLKEMNEALTVLVNLFPKVLPEVFREMLTIFDGESCLHTVADQLIKHQDKWVRGRWKISSAESVVLHGSHGRDALIPVVECFRRHSYKKAVQVALYQEFKALSKSTINAVMAEQNYSYTRTRPTLQKIMGRSWRRKIGKLFAIWRRSEDDSPASHFMVRWVSSSAAVTANYPEMKRTGDMELDQELNQTILVPLTEKLKAKQKAEDWALAMKMNEIEANNAGALYECKCCFSDTVLEQMAACTTGEHIICFRCVCQAASEAIFGQSWGRYIDQQTGQIRCLAPLSVECAGCIPRDILYRAISQSSAGLEQICVFESRLADEALLKSQLPLIRCPFCPYAEVDDLYVPTKCLRYQLNTSNPIALILLLFLALILLPLLVICTALRAFSTVQVFPNPTVLISNSLTRLTRLKYSPRLFKCQSPVCALPSCMLCFKVWHDPHICYESAGLSLRTTIEAARTAALKRTCPRCGLGFIKDSGCNKLTCVCGYIMCYLCREGLGNGGGGEGYRHFCQHFRPTGDKCGECDRCDLYRTEDEDGLIRRAGEIAEREWRNREGMVGVQGIGGQDDSAERSSWEGECLTQWLVDLWIGSVVTC